MDPFSANRRIKKGVAAIAADRRRGANELALRSLDIFRNARPARSVATECYVKAVHRLGCRLDACRPSMAAIGNVTARLVHAFVAEAGDVPTSAEAFVILERLAGQLSDEIATTGRRVAGHFSSRFSQIHKPMIISYSSQVVATLRARRSEMERITVCESRPALEGRRTAVLIAGSAASIVMITEAQIGMAMAACDGVVLGCDAIHADGSISNKTGSYLLALAASAKKKPVVVLGSHNKLTESPRQRPERHAAGEVWKAAPPIVRVENIYFETVPAALISAIIVDDGVRSPKDMRGLWRQMRRYREVFADRTGGKVR